MKVGYNDYEDGRGGHFYRLSFTPELSIDHRVLQILFEKGYGIFVEGQYFLPLDQSVPASLQPGRTGDIGLLRRIDRLITLLEGAQ